MVLSTTGDECAHPARALDFGLGAKRECPLLALDGEAGRARCLVICALDGDERVTQCDLTRRRLAGTLVLPLFPVLERAFGRYLKTARARDECASIDHNLRMRANQY